MEKEGAYSIGIDGLACHRYGFWNPKTEADGEEFSIVENLF